MELSATQLERLLREMLVKDVRPPTLKTLNVGFTRMTKELAGKALAVFGDLKHLKNIYRLSESCGPVCCTTEDDAETMCLGFPAPMTAVKVIHPNSNLGPDLRKPDLHLFM